VKFLALPSEVPGLYDEVLSNDARLIKGLEHTERVFALLWGVKSTGNAVLTADTAVFGYVGRTAVAITPKYVRGFLAGLGSGAQALEVGLFSTQSAPDGAAKTLANLVSTGTCDDVTTGISTLKGNTSPFAAVVPAGTYLWWGIRSNMATSQPQFHRIQEYGRGSVLQTASAGALTLSIAFTGTPVSVTAVVPDLYITLD
jgi:hypothetical protein